MRHFLKHMLMLGIAVSSLSMPALAADPITLTLWQVHPEWKGALQKILDRFESENPGIKIQVEQIPEQSYTAKMNTALGAGEGADIILVRPGPELRTAGESGYVIDLTGKVDTSNFTAAGLDAAQIDGKIYAMPVLGSYIVALFYNKDIFAANNLTPPKSARELMKVCEVLKEKGIPTFVAPSQDGNNPGFMYMLSVASLLGQDGIDAIRKGDRKFTDPDVVKAARFMQDLYPCFDEGALSETHVEGKAQFALGKGAMMEGGSADYAGYLETNPKINLGVIPFPALDGGKAATVQGMESNLAVNAKSKNPEAAIKFLNWLAGNEASQMVVDNIALSTNKNVSPANNPVMQEMVEASKVNNARVWYELPEVGNVYSAVGTNAQQLYLKELSPEDFSAVLQAAVDTKAK